MPRRSGVGAHLLDRVEAVVEEGFRTAAPPSGLMPAPRRRPRIPIAPIRVARFSVQCRGPTSAVIMRDNRRRGGSARQVVEMAPVLSRPAQVPISAPAVPMSLECR